MCTRYYVELSPELRPYVERARHSQLKARMVSSLGKEFRENGEIRPTDMATVIASSASGEKAAFPMVWGYHIPGIDRPVVNARAESAKEKKSFAEDWRKHRCVIPASYYFEWEHLKRPDGKVKTGQKYAIQPKGSSVTWIAGLYRMEEKNGLHYPVFTILTREPSTELLKLHDRMPVILPESAINDWIRPDSHPEEIIKNALTDMVMETADGSSGIEKGCHFPAAI